MHWAYIAGYFDGEGNAGLYPNRGKKLVRLSWYNTHLASLIAIQEFMGCGHIRERQVRNLSKKRSFVLSISRRAHVIKVIDQMLPYLIIKRDACIAIRNYAETEIHDACPKFGVVAALGEEGLRRRYLENQESVGAIAASLGVSHTAVSHALEKVGIERRPATSTKGKPKSAETRARMTASRRRLWADPEFRSRQLSLIAARRAASIHA